MAKFPFDDENDEGATADAPVEIPEDEAGGLGETSGIAPIPPAAPSREAEAEGGAAPKRPRTAKRAGGGRKAARKRVKKASKKAAAGRARGRKTARKAAAKKRGRKASAKKAKKSARRRGAKRRGR